jgi:hypothetical protein
MYLPRAHGGEEHDQEKELMEILLRLTQIKGVEMEIKVSIIR